MELLNITRSKLTKELLRLYFTNVEKGYYLRELERLLSFSVGNIRRQLIKFKKTGIFKVVKRGNLTYYYLDKSFPVFKELKSIVFKTIGITGLLKEALEKVGNINVAFIYGSFAQGKENENSDIDLCIVGNADEGKLIGAINTIESELQREINYSLYTKYEIKRKIKQNDSFIQEILKHKKVFLIGNEDDL